jgi:hypothetical protein
VVVSPDHTVLFYCILQYWYGVSKAWGFSHEINAVCVLAKPFSSVITFSFFKHGLHLVKPVIT